MSPLEEYERVKTAAEEARRERDQARGATDELLKQLKEKFGCDNVRDAKKKLVETSAELARLEAKLAKAVEEFESEFGGRLADRG